jgi:hypothetical protein
METFWKKKCSQAWFWRRRPDGFAVNEKEHIIYILEFKRVSDAGERYVAETQRVAELQQIVVTQGLQKISRTRNGQLNNRHCCRWAQVGVCKHMARPSPELWRQQIR